MLSSKLPRWVNAKRLKPLFDKALLKEGFLADLREALERAPQGTVRLPAFTIFDGAGANEQFRAIAPWRWCTPKFRGGASDLINVYELYARQGHGEPKMRKPPSPTQVLKAHGELFERGAMLNYFGGAARPPTRWMSPAMKLIALAHQVDDSAVVEKETYANGYRTRVRAQVGPAVMEVDETGIWSNGVGARLTPWGQVQASDRGAAEITFPDSSTKHALARGLVLLDAPEPLLRAAAALVLAEAAGDITSATPDWSLLEPKAPDADA